MGIAAAERVPDCATMTDSSPDSVPAGATARPSPPPTGPSQSASGRARRACASAAALSVIAVSVLSAFTYTAPVASAAAGDQSPPKVASSALGSYQVAVSATLRNEKVTVSGAASALASRPFTVQVYQNQFWRTAAKGRSNKNGEFKTVLPMLWPDAQVKVRVFFPEYTTRSIKTRKLVTFPASALPATTLTQGVDQELVFTAPPTQVALGSVSVVTVSTDPLRPKQKVELQKLAGARWIAVGRYAFNPVKTDQIDAAGKAIYTQPTSGTIKIPTKVDETLNLRLVTFANKAESAVSDIFTVTVGAGTAPLDDIDADRWENDLEAEAGTDPTKVDTDGDGLTDGLELRKTSSGGYASDPLSTDTDADGLDDGFEVFNGSKPTKVDTDADGITDPDEFRRGTRPGTFDKDPDLDGFTDTEEKRYGTNPTVADTDADGFSDGEEMLVRGTNPHASQATTDSDGDGLFDVVEPDLGTDPDNPDTDGDGLLDGQEAAFNTDPLHADTDGDGLTDGAEVQGFESDPTRIDTDGDRLLDAEEAALGTRLILIDTDGDGLSDYDEVRVYGTDPLRADTDGDGLTDGAEVLTHRTDPKKKDTDGDGVSDKAEIEAGTDPRTAPGDVDGDGLNNADELAAGTDPNNPDTDGDGLSDGAEVRTHRTDPLVVDTDADGVDDGAEVTAGTDPRNADTDGDGLTDGEEKTHGTNPKVVDTDGDGLTDATEINTHGTDPTRADTDGDGLDDDAELGQHGTDPLNPDTDADGLTDGAEVNTHGTDPLNLDTDGDGLTDGAEVLVHGSSPKLVDTDSDTFNDPDEVLFGSNPADATSIPPFRALSAARYNTCGLRAYQLFCWGAGGDSQIGDGTTTSRTAPVRVGAAQRWAQVAPGASNTCAVTVAGALYCWGFAGNGQLGNGVLTASTRSTPTRVGTDNDWRQVSTSSQPVTGTGVTCAVKTDNSLWCFGHNGKRQLMDGTTTHKATPVNSSSGRSWESVSVGSTTVCAVEVGGALYCWGENYSGATGQADRFATATSPQLVGTGFANVSVGHEDTSRGSSFADGHACGVKTTGQLWCWGSNTSGELGNNLTATLPTRVGTDSTWTQVAAGGAHTCATRSDASVWCFGSDLRHELGSGPNLSQNSAVPVQVQDLTGKTPSSLTGPLVAAGEDHSCALTASNQVQCWGLGFHGQLGGFLKDPTLVDTDGDTLTDAQEATFGTNPAVRDSDTDGVIDGTEFNLDSSGTSASSTPQTVEHTGAPGASCLVNASGTLACWGSWQMMPDGARTDRIVPTAMGTGFASVSIGNAHACAIKAGAGGGALYCWGSNINGQVGVGSAASRVDTMTQVGVETDWVQVVADANYTCGIRAASDSLYCWGAATSGRLGLGAAGSRNTPGLVGTGWRTVAAQQGSTTCGIKTDGTLWCWGSTQYGSVGDGTTGAGIRTTPVQIATAKSDWVSLAGSQNENCATDSTQVLYCWGNNSATSTHINGGGANVPTAYPGLSVTKVTGGYRQMCAVRASDSVVLCWGNPSYYIGSTPANVPSPAFGGGPGIQVTGSMNGSCHLSATRQLNCYGTDNGYLFGLGSTFTLGASFMGPRRVA